MQHDREAFDAVAADIAFDFVQEEAGYRFPMNRETEVHAIRKTIVAMIFHDLETVEALREVSSTYRAAIRRATPHLPELCRRTYDVYHEVQRGFAA